MTIIEKIIAAHSKQSAVKPGDIVDVFIDARVARDFGGANVVENILNNGLSVNDPSRTFFTFDCNPGGSDQKYAANQHFCRLYARQNDIKVYDVDAGVGTHLAIDKGLAYPGSTFVSTDSHANIMGAIGAFGQGMGDQDIAAAWAKGSVWFKVPESVKIILKGKKPANVSAKDIVLNLLNIYGANKLLGYSVEIEGEAADELTLDERITIASMGTEMGVIILLFSPSDKVLSELEARTGKRFESIKADGDASYVFVHEIDVAEFVPMVANPGHPHDDVPVAAVKMTKIDSAFLGSCTNGRIEDLRIAASILKGKKVAPGVVFKVVPATDEIWRQALDEGLIQVFKDAGALVSNAGCAGCAAGQIGQNGPEEISISTGNRNFAGKQGKGSMFLASPATVTASAIAGYITTADDIPEAPAVFGKKDSLTREVKQREMTERPTVVEGNAWVIEKDDIDTDMIFHNRYLTITNIKEMGQYTFDNLKGYEDFAKKAQPGDIVFTAKNFGAGSSRQQAVDCFLSLGVSAIIAESFGAIYERNAINAAMPILTYKADQLQELELAYGDRVKVDFHTGEVSNITKGKTVVINKFYDAQMQIYKNGGLL
ncbi:MAG TPA: aconitase/3-isopropylmalate dehydratase large subunit family protein [Bacteroidales bacterium]|jgi:3-isopropylmalate dehydratase small subunit|nr:aconitase/3-isopropylmalate dehydratase large subunit family protein [Bacteroidales bacterium]